MNSNAGKHGNPSQRVLKRVGSRTKSRRLRCDCGHLAVTTIIVQVGCDPLYTINLPLCRDCLALEQAMHTDG